MSSERLTSVERKMTVYEKFGREIISLVCRDLKVELSPTQIKRFGLAWKAAAWVDYNLDSGILSKEALVSIRASNELPSVFGELEKIFPDSETYNHFLNTAFRSIQYSNHGTVVGRHKEGLLFVNALVDSLCVDTETRRKLLSIMWPFASSANFADDIFDRHIDNSPFGLILQKSVAFKRQFFKALGRINSPIRFTYEFYRICQKLLKEHPLNQ